MSGVLRALIHLLILGLIFTQGNGKFTNNNDIRNKEHSWPSIDSSYSNIRYGNQNINNGHSEQKENNNIYSKQQRPMTPEIYQNYAEKYEKEMTEQLATDSTYSENRKGFLHNALKNQETTHNTIASPSEGLGTITTKLEKNYLAKYDTSTVSEHKEHDAIYEETLLSTPASKESVWGLTNSKTLLNSKNYNFDVSEQKYEKTPKKYFFMQSFPISTEIGDDNNEFDARHLSNEDTSMDSQFNIRTYTKLNNENNLSDNYNMKNGQVIKNNSQSAVNIEDRSSFSSADEHETSRTQVIKMESIPDKKYKDHSIAHNDRLVENSKYIHNKEEQNNENKLNGLKLPLTQSTPTTLDRQVRTTQTNSSWNPETTDRPYWEIALELFRNRTKQAQPHSYSDRDDDENNLEGHKRYPQHPKNNYWKKKKHGSYDSTRRKATRTYSPRKNNKKWGYNNKHSSSKEYNNNYGHKSRQSSDRHHYAKHYKNHDRPYDSNYAYNNRNRFKNEPRAYSNNHREPNNFNHNYKKIRGVAGDSHMHSETGDNYYKDRSNQNYRNEKNNWQSKNSNNNQEPNNYDYNYKIDHGDGGHSQVYSEMGGNYNKNNDIKHRNQHDKNNWHSNNKYSRRDNYRNGNYNNHQNQDSMFDKSMQYLKKGYDKVSSSFKKAFSN